MPIYPDHMFVKHQTEDPLSSISERIASIHRSIEQIVKEPARQARQLQESFAAQQERSRSLTAGLHIPLQLRVQHTTKKDRELEDLRAQVLRLKRELSIKNDTINKKDDTIITLQKQKSSLERLLDAYAHTRELGLKEKEIVDSRPLLVQF